jgi:L-amino acid N-acyltransferase YncA
MIGYALESLDEFLPEFKESLVELHYEEIALDKSAVPLDPDYDKYYTLEANGNLFLMTVRKDEELIGYFIAIISAHLHYKSTLHCLTDIYYLKPQYRGTTIGYRMFKEVETRLEELKVVKWINGCKLHSGLDHTRLFEGLGFNHSEKIFTKLL